MLEAPGMGLEGEERRRAVSSDYPELVNKEILKAELILKVLLATPKTIADTYIELFNGGSTPDLQQILEVRGKELRKRTSMSLMPSKSISSRFAPLPYANLIRSAKRSSRDNY